MLSLFFSAFPPIAMFAVLVAVSEAMPAPRQSSWDSCGVQVHECAEVLTPAKTDGLQCSLDDIIQRERNRDQGCIFESFSSRARTAHTNITYGSEL